MKRIIVLLLVLVLIGLCACTGAPQNGQSLQNKPGKDSENAETPNAPTGSTILRFTINPEFVLYLDEAQNILSAEAENEDAKALFAQLDVVGKPYAEAITAILDAAYTQGYLKEGSEIKVTVDMPQSADSSLAFIKLPISAFEREKDLTTNTAISLPAEPTPKNSSVEIDGRKYNISVEPLYDGESTEDNPVQVGTITKYISKRLTEEDAPTSYSRKEIVQFFSGDTWVIFYHNDTVLRRVDTYVNGEFSDISYYPDGSTATYYTASANGDFSYQANAEDGTELESEYLMDGEYFSYQLQEDGTTRSYTVHSDGKRVESIFNSNGTMIKYVEHYPNGDYSIITYYDNGAMQYDESFLEGAHIFVEYYENGTIKNSKRVETDGSWQEFAFDSNETIISWQQYDANGQLIDSDTYTEEQPEQKTAE